MPAAAQHPPRLRDHPIGFMREMQRLMDDDAVDRRIGHRQVQEIALVEVDRHRLVSQLGARDAPPVGAAVELSVERRVRKGGDSTCDFWWSPSNSTKT